MSYVAEVQVIIEVQGLPAREDAEKLVSKAGKTSDLILYGTSACHLCELAEALLLHRQKADAVAYVKCDISESDELFTRYGVRIPVLQRADGAELDWPFSELDLDVFLATTDD